MLRIRSATHVASPDEHAGMAKNSVDIPSARPQTRANHAQLSRAQRVLHPATSPDLRGSWPWPSEHRRLYAESAKGHRGTLDCNVRSLALFANTILLLALRVAFARMVFVGTNQLHNHWNRSGQARIGCRRR